MLISDWVVGKTSPLLNLSQEKSTRKFVIRGFSSFGENDLATNAISTRLHSQMAPEKNTVLVSNGSKTFRQRSKGPSEPSLLFQFFTDH